MKIFQVGTTAKMVRITTDTDRLIIQVPLNKMAYSISGVNINFIITTNNSVITEIFSEVKRQDGTGFNTIQDLASYLTSLSSETSGSGMGGVTQQELETRVSQAESSLNNNITQLSNNLYNEINITNNNLSNVSDSLGNKLDIAKAETPVLSLSDLPAPVSGVITLAPNVTYRFQGLIDIGLNQIRVSTSNTLMGFDRNDDGIIFSGTTHPLIIENNTVSIDGITILLTNANAKFFDIQNTITHSVIFKKCIFAGGGGLLGTVDGSNVFGIDNCIVASLVQGGVQISGVVNDITLSNNIFLNKDSPIQVDLNNLTSNSILITDNIFKTEQIGVKVNNVTLQGERMGIITSNGFSGSGTYISGIYDDTTEWLLGSNSNGLSTLAGYSPNNYYVIKEDFIVASSETGEVGELGWSFTNGNIDNGIYSSLGRPGVIRRSTSNTTGQFCTFYLGRGANIGTVAFGDFISLIWIVRMTTTNPSEFFFRCGASQDWRSANPSNAIYFEKTELESTWHIVSRRNGLETKIDTEIPVTTDFIKLEIIKTVEDTLKYRIDENLYVEDINTNIPINTALLNFGNTMITRVGSIRSFDMDYFSAIIKTGNR